MAVIDGYLQRVRRRLGSPAPLPLHTDWRQLLKGDEKAWRQARRKAEGGPKVLIATGIGGHEGLTSVESLLAVALTLRGAEVHFLLCDGFLPACMRATSQKFKMTSEFAEHGPANALCPKCSRLGAETYAPLGLPVHHYSELVTAAEQEAAGDIAGSIPVEQIADFRLDGLAVGEHALAGALRYFARGSLEGEAFGEAILRRYLRASVLTTFAVSRLLDDHDFACACFNHGIYVPQGLVGEVARNRGVRVVNWNPAYRKRCLIFSHNDTYHHTLMSEPTSMWENLPWTPVLDADLMAYLKSRWSGSQDWIWFHNDPQEDLARIAGEVGVDFSKPTIGLLTNVMWDAQLHYPANAFPNMLDWLLRTVAYFGGRPELQLVIRVHPAEIRGTVPSRQKIVEELQAHFPVLPDNVFVIPPESNVSTYAVMLQCDTVLIYGTKTGVELTSFGVPVIVAGEAWIRNKGVTLDAQTADDYFRYLDRLPSGAMLDEATLKRARRYAYHFFFRRMIPVSCIEPQEGWPPYRLSLTGLEALRPGREPGLDVICDGIMQGTPFVYPAERLRPGAPESSL